MPFAGTEAKFVKPEVFSLEGLVAWLETQEPKRTYNYDNCLGGCLLSLYLRAAGADPILDYGKLWKATASLSEGIAHQRPHTYGAALSRARQLLATA